MIGQVISWLVSNPTIVIFVVILLMGISLVFKLSKKVMKIIFVCGVVYAVMVFLTGGF